MPILSQSGGDASLGGFPEQRLELGKGVLDRVEVGTVGRKVEQARQSVCRAAGGAAPHLDWRAAEPIPPELNVQRLVEGRLARRSGPRRIAFAASVMLSLGLGGAVGWTAHDAMQAEPSVVAWTGVGAVSAEALTAHRVFAADPRQPVE